MSITQDIKPVTYLKSRAADILKQINETHRPVIITQNGEPKAVLQDPESYENMRNAIGILLHLLPADAQGSLLNYYTSGDLLNDYSSSVSYVSIVFKR